MRRPLRCKRLLMPTVLTVATVLLSIALTGCKTSPAQYCKERNAAWKRAYGHEQSAAERKRVSKIFVKSCTKVMSKKKKDNAEEYKCRLKCLKKHIRGETDKTAAQQAYLKLNECDRTCQR